ncbi:hypothetical protein LN042_16140 [Kitasatospora sp. RB6PN24]|uniref:hypothetical protein n=1 Tax=Kitasatospora humi TaxID=2893891 RepID=UPI001E64F01F|nr:hypothetical protein [Kitasatospora humi]MCC9308598.1 hypothetical protein [Kitasatospora humi]
MRSVFQCAECGVHYLPPEGVRWSDGSAASPLWCDVHHVAARRHGITAPAAATAAALLAARLREAAAARELPAQRDVRPSRPARTRRAPAPRGRRSKLG